MTPFLETLQSHKGGLIKLKTVLYWYDGRGWDKNPGRICLLLDVAIAGGRPRTAAFATGTSDTLCYLHSATLLLIDGSPQWVWVADSDVELLPEKL